jgi:hypothetical protein
VAERSSSAGEYSFGLTIRCEKCGGYAFLAKCVDDARKPNGSEIWTYECVDCGHKSEKTVKM